MAKAKLYGELGPSPAMDKLKGWEQVGTRLDGETTDGH